MKIIIAEESATRGRVQIGGYNIHSSLSEAYRQMGYCPQHDAQWKNITVREHLECYAAIRGVPRGEIRRIVDLYLSGLQIHEHADKQTQECSGGTKRKLSFAMAMIGGPKVVLMDEPSTGMDPRSKRFLWDTILASFQVNIHNLIFFSFQTYPRIFCFKLPGWARCHFDHALDGRGRCIVLEGGHHGQGRVALYWLDPAP